MFPEKPFTKEIGYGVLDVHFDCVETKDEVKKGSPRTPGTEASRSTIPTAA
jgi:methionine synthase II (cobalamin-independent)